jgi:hypothetical protein
MGLFKAIFGSGKSISSIISESEAKIFRLHGITNPNDSQKIKVLFYLCMSTIAIFNELSDGKGAPVMDKLVNETARLAKLEHPNQVRVCELGNSSEEMRLILADFPKELEIGLQTKLGGSTAFDTLYSALGRITLEDFMRAGKNASMGVPGYAAATLVRKCFSSDAHFLEVAAELLEVTAKIAEAA